MFESKLAALAALRAASSSDHSKQKAEISLVEQLQHLRAVIWDCGGGGDAAAFK